MIRLNCPSCGGELSLPDSLSIAHCMFCGAKILLDEIKNTPNINYENYIELADSAIKAENYKEALEFINSALIANPKNSKLWLNKAVCISNLFPYDYSRNKEVALYL